MKRTEGGLAEAAAWRVPASPDEVRRIRRVLWGAAIALSVTAYSLISWDWSLVDDADFKATLTRYVHQRGALGGLIHNTTSLAQLDWSSGHFRPVMCVYVSLFYLLNPLLAHLVRLGMFAVAVVAGVVFVRRHVAVRESRLAVTTWATALLLANPSLYENLTLLSLQELTGLFFVACAFLAPRGSLRTLLLLLAALTRPPFVWILLADACFSLGRRRWLPAVSGIATGVAVLVGAGMSTRHGWYTAHYHLTLSNAVATVRTVVPYAAPAALVLMLGFVSFPVRWSARRPADDDAVALVVGGVLYFVNLLPWANAGSYLASPIVYLVSLGAAAALANRAGLRARSPRRMAVGLTASLVVGLAILGRMAWFEYERNAAVVGMVRWELSLPPRGITIATNGEEASTRLRQLAQMHVSDWQNTVVYVPEGAALPSAAKYYVVVADAGRGDPVIEARSEEIREWVRASVYRIRG